MEDVRSLVSLEYPNGRTHDTVLIGQSELQPGQAFYLHGRHWRAVDPPVRRRRFANEPERILCRPVAELETG